MLSRGDTSIPEHPSILTGPPAPRASKPLAKKTPANTETSYQERSQDGGGKLVFVSPPPRPQSVTTHLYPHDGKVWHGRVVEVDAGVELALGGREDLGAAGRRRVVEHLAQGEDVDEFGGEPGAHRVIRACHALHAVCGGTRQRRQPTSAHPHVPREASGPKPRTGEPRPPWGQSLHGPG